MPGRKCWPSLTGVFVDAHPGIASHAYGWRAGMIARVFAALSPLLAIVGVSPSADAPTAWFVLGRCGSC